MIYGRADKHIAGRKVQYARQMPGRLRKETFRVAHAQFEQRRDIPKARISLVRRILDAKVEGCTETAEMEMCAKISAAQNQIKKGKLREKLGGWLQMAGISGVAIWAASQVYAPFDEKRVIPAIIAGAAFVASFVARWAFDAFAKKGYLRAVNLAKEVGEVREKAVIAAGGIAERIMPPMEARDSSFGAPSLDAKSGTPLLLPPAGRK